jgi:flagellar basal body-associated protein FliL
MQEININSLSIRGKTLEKQIENTLNDEIKVGKRNCIIKIIIISMIELLIIALVIAVVFFAKKNKEKKVDKSETVNY